MTIDPQRIADLVTEDPNLPAIGGVSGVPAPRLDPEQFVNGINGIINSAPHGRQTEALARVMQIGQSDPTKLVELLQKVEPAYANRYVQDFYKSKASNIMVVAKIAGLIYDDDTVMQILDSIEPQSEVAGEPDEEEDELYNSEGDGYSH